jgi:hypothetical protein
LKDAADRWLDTSAGKITAGLGCVTMGTYAAGHLLVAPDSYFPTFGWLASPLAAMAPVLVIAGALLVWSELWPSSGDKVSATWWSGFVKGFLPYFVAATAVTAIWVKPALQSDRVFAGFDPDLIVAEGDPVVFLPVEGRPLLVGSVATTGEYDRRYDPARTYIGVELDSDAPEAAYDVEPSVLEDAFAGDTGRVLGLNGIARGPSGSVVLLREDG